MQSTTRPITSAEDRANGAFYKVMESAPMGLLVMAALGLAIAGVFQFIFYFQVIPADWSATLRSVMAGALAVFFEGLGFYFLVTTVRDFSAGARKEGWIGLAATFLLWSYALWEGTHIAAAFDGNTAESYWSIFGILGTIICIVRIVELRITLTVTSAMKRKQQQVTAETEAADLRKELAATTAKLFRYQSEEQAEKEAQAEEARQRAEQAEIEFRTNVEKQAQELATLKRKMYGYDSAVKITGSNRAEIVEEVRKNIKRNSLPPSQATIAAILKISARTVRNQFPNGSWESMINEIQQAETPAESISLLAN